MMGEPLPGSRPFDSSYLLPEVLAAMAPLPGPVDAFVVTHAVCEREKQSSPLLREAFEHGLDLLTQETSDPPT